MGWLDDLTPNIVQKFMWFRLFGAKLQIYFDMCKNYAKKIHFCNFSGVGWSSGGVVLSRS